MKERILIVEDNSSIRESLAELLSLNGYDIAVADSGENGITIINAYKPDLIICDILMNGMDGYEFYSKVQQNFNNIPFIFSTAKSEKRDILKAAEMGVCNYLTKPFDEDELLKCIVKCLQQSLL
ncbi:MAG: response regulator [Mucilaginibacter sp.]